MRVTLGRVGCKLDNRNSLRTLSGTALSPAAFGTMQFGAGSDDRSSMAIYQVCRDVGINHFDTAHAYTKGMSEQLLGHYVAAEREDVFVATKVGYTGGADPSNLTTQFDESRRRLNLDVIDLLYLHRFDPNTELERVLEWFASQQAQGRIRYIGVSNFAAWQVMKAQSVIAPLGHVIGACQPMYNLVKRQAETEIFPVCMDQDIATFTYSPLGAGLLTGKYIGETINAGRFIADPRYARRYGQQDMHHTAQGLVGLAQEHNLDPATLAVAWVMKNPSVNAPLLSARTLDQLAPSLAALKYTLNDDLYAALTALSRTPAPATDRLEEQTSLPGA